MNTQKEPWDFEKFVRHYNAIASEQAGYIFDPDDDGQNPPHLQETYEQDSTTHTLREYAENRFRYDQRF